MRHTDFIKPGLCKMIFLQKKYNQYRDIWNIFCFCRTCADEVSTAFTLIVTTQSKSDSFHHYNHSYNYSSALTSGREKEDGQTQKILRTVFPYSVYKKKGKRSLGKTQVFIASLLFIYMCIRTKIYNTSTGNLK